MFSGYGLGENNQNLLERNQERIKEPNRDGMRKGIKEKDGRNWKRILEKEDGEENEIIRRRDGILKTDLDKIIQDSWMRVDGSRNCQYYKKIKDSILREENLEEKGTTAEDKRLWASEGQMRKHMQRMCDKEPETSEHVEECENFKIFIGLETK